MNKTGFNVMSKVEEGMDEQCIELCRSLNAVPGIETYESCCGHGLRPY